MVNAVPYQLLKRGKDIYLSCSPNPDRSYIYANLKPFPPVSNQSDNYTVDGAMLDYELTPYKTEIIIEFTDREYNLIGDIYVKVLDLYYANAVPFSIDVPDVPTPQLPSAYSITLIIADKNDDPHKSLEIHACAYANFGF
ncbi:unnamed protein product [Rhizophagus irregularis]|uniref:Uncharacterized protein n=1 Tax=Rhizophagus irregularis TaxID=588596 RepID=A0A2N1N1I4_9GLOM|nr:hypothetical protein RhiirC2_783139 [Rhizophagus irregularis]CAB4398744.1 unnamed protein product [Rhizophagus irregularis]CAB5368360.1 unnamed protein product [Rhizophagus irregularis]